jgi:Cu(I)/Ag(I) efflux system membrane fusion protein
LAGIQTAEIAERPLAREIRTVGYVSYDESRLSRIVSRVSGYVEKLAVNQTFVQVQQGDPLGEVYSPQLYTTVQELLIALKSNSKDLVEMTRDKLRLLGIDQREIDDIESARQANYRLVLRAPRSGHVVRKDVVEGDRVEAGQVLFQIADLSKVWVEAEIFEKDIAYLAVGQPIAATVEAFPTNLFAGKVALVYPELRSATRTNRVRFEMDNPELLLRPGMYATVRIEMRVQEIEPFKTQLAARKAEPDPNDEQAFIAYQKTCPVTGAKLGSMGKPVRATVDDHTLYLCCASCEDQLAEQPERFLARTGTVSESGVLAVPEQAVIDTGDQQIVYVEREPGVFEGVEVKLGARAGGYYPVVEGLLPGDRVAAAGAFLIDAETRLNPAASSAYFGASGSRQSSAEPSISNSKNSNAGNRDAH